LHLPPDLPLGCDQPKTLYRYHAIIREHLDVKAYKGKEARHTAVSAAYQAAEVMDQQTDLINATIDELVRQKYELPAFSTIDRIVERVHAVEHRRVFGQVLKRLSPEQANKLDNLLQSEADQKFTAFNALKDLPKRSTVWGLGSSGTVNRLNARKRATPNEESVTYKDSPRLHRRD
jgi:hypothetical protein